MINNSDTSALTFQAESPLSKLVEHCNKFGHDSKVKLEKLEATKAVTTESLLLPPEMNPYAAYHSFIPPTNWWVDQTGWQLTYPTTTTSAAELPYHSYLSNPLLLGGSGAPVNMNMSMNMNMNMNIAATSAANLAAAAAASSSSSLVHRSKPKPSSSSSSSSTSVGGTSTNGGSGGTGGSNSIGNTTSTTTSNTAGGKYQSRSNCECPNCKESERIGIDNLAARKRGVHNCHIAGCGKVYSKSSHLKAHLRWHNDERPSRRRTNDAAASSTTPNV